MGAGLTAAMSFRVLLPRHLIQKGKRLKVSENQQLPVKPREIKFVEE